MSRQGVRNRHTDSVVAAIEETRSGPDRGAMLSSVELRQACRTSRQGWGRIKKGEEDPREPCGTCMLCVAADRLERIALAYREVKAGNADNQLRDPFALRSEDFA